MDVEPDDTTARRLVVLEESVDHGVGDDRVRTGLIKKLLRGLTPMRMAISALVFSDDLMPY